jgi:transcriptional antiterminator RfaH
MRLSINAKPGNPEPSAINPVASNFEWFCVQAQPNRVSVATEALRQLPEVDSFLPLLQFRRLRRNRPVLVTEPLFPGYLFARFIFEQSLRAVYYSQGVSRVIHFGDHWPVIPQDTIDQLKLAVGEAGVRLVESPVAPGDEVQINSGPFQNLSGLVNRIYPGKMRIAVLLEFLGRQTMVEVSLDNIQPVKDIRQNMFGPE